MRGTSCSRVVCVTAAIAFAVGVGGVAPAAAAAEGDSVASLLGSWGGSGRVHYTDGSSQNITCTGHYTGGGNDLSMAIQCKSDTTPIHIRSKLHVNGGRASGQWEERTYNAAGNATGSFAPGKLNVRLAGGGFSGSMSVSFSKSSQSISVSTQGIGMSRASISFSRR